MNELMKIRDVSIKYDLSARTLRYYEDMGLITSIRSDDYAYRLSAPRRGALSFCLEATRFELFKIWMAQPIIDAYPPRQAMPTT